MIAALKVTIPILLAFTALGIVCAVRISLRRSIPQADPFFHPFGDAPAFSDAHRIAIERRSSSAGVALRRDADGGRSVPSRLASIGKLLCDGNDATQ